MERTITLHKVQAAIRELRDNGERVSRRNVLAITGGGMSTVHQLMSQVEDLEALQASVPDPNISEELRKVLLVEIGTQVKKATETLQEQIRQLQGREQEALEALAAFEARTEKLSQALMAARGEVEKERLAKEKAGAVAAETIARQEKMVSGLRAEKMQLNSSLESERIELARSRVLLENATQAADTSASKSRSLDAELERTRKTLAETGRRAAAAKQQVLELQKALTKVERRAQRLESYLAQPSEQ